MTKSQLEAGWGSRFCVFELAPGDSSAGLVRLKPIAELFGPVVTDESDPVFMGADGHECWLALMTEKHHRLTLLPPNGSERPCCITASNE
jgi:hypothetical protein